MDMPHAPAVLVEYGERIPAAVHNVPSVQHQAEERCTRPRHQLIDLLDGFDMTAAMRMKHRAEPRFLAHRPRDALGAIGKRRPLREIETVLEPDAAGILFARGNA